MTLLPLHLLLLLLLQLTFSTGKCATLHFTGCTRFSMTDTLSPGIHEYFLYSEFGFIVTEVTLWQLPTDWIVLSCAEVFCCATCKFILAKQCPSILMENYSSWISMEKSTHRKEPSVKMMRWDKWETRAPPAPLFPLGSPHSWRSTVCNTRSPPHLIQ